VQTDKSRAFRRYGQPGGGLQLCFAPVDLALMFGLAASLGLLLASHVALSVGLALRGPWQRALLAFVVPPLAPLWGYSGRLHARALLWIIALVTHVACLTAAAIGGGAN
jgi:hypothetical protein